MRLEVDTRYTARRPWVPRPAELLRWAAAALGAPRRPTRLSVVVVGAARSRSLNLRYRGKAKPTNVLSFAGAGRGPDGHIDLGELVICAPVVAAEARAAHIPPRARWAHMVVHGVLHLAGHDHVRDDEAARMMARETQILEKMGFSDPYA